MIGARFGRLVAIRVVPDWFRRADRDSRTPGVECVCDCGETVIVRAGSLRSGNTRSCGCLFRELITGNTRFRDAMNLRRAALAKPRGTA